MARRLLLALSLAVLPGSGTAQTVTPGEAVLQKIHDRYSTTRFRTLSFIQRTTFPDGRVEWWYEAESIPGKARVDIAPLANGNMQIFRNDSAYIFRGSQLTRSSSGLAATMWLLMDMYAIPVSETAAALRKRNFDLGRSYEKQHNGRPVIVIGASEPADTTSQQFWLDKEHLYAVKLIVQQGVQVVDVSKHVFMGGGWVEQEIRVYRNGTLALLEEYTNTKVGETFPSDLFEPDQYRAPPWKEIQQ